MKNIYKKNWMIVVLCLLSGFAFAAIPNEKVTFGSIADDLGSTVDIITRLMHIACWVTGAAMFGMAIMFYRAHLQNPKFMPLDRLVLYVVLGFVLVCIPFLGKIFGPTGSSIDTEQREIEQSGVQIRDIDAPLNWGNDYDH